MSVSESEYVHSVSYGLSNTLLGKVLNYQIPSNFISRNDQAVVFNAKNEKAVGT